MFDQVLYEMNCCVVNLTFVLNKYGKMLSIHGALKQTLFIKLMSSNVCDVVRNLFKMLMKFISFCFIICLNSCKILYFHAKSLFQWCLNCWF
jgi:hypothetical protein